MMKCIAILSIMAVLLSGQVLSREYILEPNTEPLSSRSFGLLNLFNRNKDASSTRLTNLESAVAPIISGFANLQNQVAALNTSLAAAEASNKATNIRLAAAETTIADLKKQMATAAATPTTVPTCPTKAPATAKIVMEKCYDVVGTPVSFAAAQAACIAGSGKLAEPTPGTATALYAALQTAFPTPTTTIGTSGAWIGLVQAPGALATSPFFFTSTPGTPVANSFLTNPTALPAAGDTVKSVGFLATPNPLVAATPFTAIDSTPAANTKGFICQY